MWPSDTGWEGLGRVGGCGAGWDPPKRVVMPRMGKASNVDLFSWSDL